MKTSALKGVRDEHRLAHTAINYLLSIFQTLASQYGAMAIVSRWHEYFFKDNNLLILNMRFVCYFFLLFGVCGREGRRWTCYVLLRLFHFSRSLSRHILFHDYLGLFSGGRIEPNERNISSER